MKIYACNADECHRRMAELTGHLIAGGPPDLPRPSTSCHAESALLYRLYRRKSATPFHTNCTAMDRIRNPKIRLIAPMALGPRRLTNGPPSRRKR
jgi:hypothetical protein